VSITLKKYRERLVEELEDSEPTEKFTLYINNLFDSLNRRYPGEGIYPGSPDIEVSNKCNISKDSEGSCEQNMISNYLSVS